MENMSLCSSKEVQKLQDGNEILEYNEGTLLDNFIFYSEKLQKYVMCVEHYLNTWCSCYKVLVGSMEEIYSRWDYFFSKV